MMGNIPGNLLQSIITLDNLQNAGCRIFKEPRLIIIEVFLLDNIYHIIVKEIIGQTYFRHTAAVEQRHRRAVLYGLGEVILGNIIAKPLVGQSLGA